MYIFIHNNIHKGGDSERHKKRKKDTRLFV